MSTKTYAKGHPLSRGRFRALSGTGRLEAGILAAVLLVGVLVGVLLDSFLFGFAAVALVAVLARLVLEIVGSGSHPEGAPAHHE
jgi:hypothetical protein